MNPTNNLCQMMKAVCVAAVLLVLPFIASSQDLYSGGTGNYNAITWYQSPTRTGPTGTPIATSVLHIGNGHNVTIPSNTTVTFAGIEVHDTGASGTFTIGNSTNTATTLTITGDITINSAGSFVAGGNGGATHSMLVGGNITSNNIFNMISGSNDVINTTFINAATKTISGSASTFTFNNFTVSTLLSSNINVNTSIRINGAFSFTADGILIVNSTSDVTLGSAATVAGSTSARYVQLDGTTGTNSQLIKVSTNNVSSWQIVYPIGTATGGYTPLDLTTANGSAMATSPVTNSTLAVKAIYNSSIQGQLRRQFRMVVAGNTNATTFTNGDFSYNSATDVSQGDVLANYTTLWYLSLASPTWTSVTGTAPGSGFFTAPGSGQSLQTGTYYFTIGTSTAYPGTWYSYQDGVWSNPDVWTQDPSGTTLVNPLTQSPSTGDQVVILNGFTVTGDVNSIILSTTTIQGGATLDMGTTTGNNLGVISGSGLLRINGPTLPTGTYTNFVAASTGGTIEFYDIGGTLSTQTTTYNNLLFTNTTNNNITFITASNLTVNNDLNVTQSSGTGTVTWQINDASNTQRTMSIDGDLTVSASGQIRVGTGNEASTTPHSLTLYGNLTNNGSIKFFDASDAEFADSEYTSRAVFINELQGNAVNVTFTGLTNSTVTCNNLTDFYRFIMNKGTGQQATMTVNSSSTSNFRIFGPNNILMGGTSPNHFSNSGLSLQNGTLILLGSINIPSLCEVEVAGSTSDGQLNGYPIPQNAALWLNSASVTVQVAPTTGPDDLRQIYLYGLLRISAGTFNLGYSRGLLGTLAGQFLIEGDPATSVLNTMQLRTTQNSAGNTFSYTQNGGTVNVGTSGLSGVTETNAPRFSIPFTTCTFKMSGGVLNVANPISSGVAVNGGILISVASSNISVTGGTVNAIAPASATNFIINSNAPFYNLNILQEGAGTAAVALGAVTARINGVDLAFTAQPLVVQNNITIATGNNPDFNCNNNNLTIGGTFDIQSATTFAPGTNTITFNGSGAQAWTNNGTISSINNLIVSKTTGTVLTLGGANALPSITALTLTSGTLNDGGKTLTVTGTLSNSATHTGSGVIVANGPTAIGGSGGTFGNLTLQTNATLTTSGTQSVTGTLRLLSANTTLNIASNALSVLGSIFSDATTAVAFTATKRIQTSGLRNDGGLTRQAASGVDLLFPVGTSPAATAYTPITINTTASTAGVITIRPVTGAHPNVTTASQSVQFFWRVTSTGFAGITAVSHKTYTYASATRDAASATYRPARYNPATFTWAYGPTYNATTGAGLTTIPNFNTGTGWTGLASDQLDGEYTAGNLTAFGAVTVYYSRASGAWNQTNTWSNIAVGGTAAASAPPCASCPVVIGDGAANNHAVTIDANNRSAGSLFIALGSSLDLGVNTGLNFGVNTSGTGTLRIGSANFPAGDFTDFLNTGGGTVEWYGPSYTIPTTGPAPQSIVLDNYNNIIVSPNTGASINLPTTDLQIYANFTANGTGTGIVNTDATGSRTVTVANDLRVSSGVLRMSNATVANFIVNGNTTVDNGATFNLQGGTTITHSFVTSGNVTNNGTFTFRSGTIVANITFNGPSNSYFTGTNASATTTLNQITVNKGSSAASVLTFDMDGTLNMTANSLVLQNGTFDFNKTGGSITLTNTAATPYSIPSTTRLLVRSGTVNISIINADDSDLLLAGALEVAGGTVNIGNGSANNNDIEYASAGTPTITVSSGSLTVNGAVRRATTTLTGALVYNQTGGTVTIGGRNCTGTPNNTRGIFEIENTTGSSFTLTGTSSFTMVRQTGGTQFADLYINPASSNISSSSTIQLGDNALGARTMRINIVPTVGNLTVLGATSNAQTVDMQSSTLTVSGILTINQASILNTNTLDVNIGGDLAINTTGTYNGSANTTTFNGTGAQSGSLSATSSFETITVDKSSGTVTLSGTSPTITNLNILNGILDVSTIGLTVTGDVVNNSSQIGSGSITMSGTSSTHTITSSGGSFTNLTLGTGATTKTVTVSGNMTVNGALTFATTNRFLSIGSSLLTLGSASSIVGAGATAFIRTNGVASDLGVVKTWPVAGASTFNYPVGTSNNYTPVSVTMTVTTSGNLSVIPVNSRHPTYNVASTEQILNYYWIITRSSTLAYAVSGSHVYSYPSSLMGGSGGTLRAGYLDLANPTGWVTSGHGGTASTTTMVYTDQLNINLPSANNTYHLSVGTTNTLPNPIVPVYSRLANASVANSAVGGNWNDPNSWTTASNGMGAALSSAPYGVPVVVLSGARINMNVTARIAFTSQINGLLVIGSTVGHNLGIMSGTGTMRVATNTFPAGNYTTYVSSSGGTIEYVGPMTMNNRTTYNNLSITGTGNVAMTNSDLVLNGGVTIASGATLNNNANNRNITLAGNWSNSGTFTTGTGTVIFNGSSSSTISGTTAFNNLTVSKSNNVTLSGTATTTVNTTLTLTSGHIISTSTHPLVIGSSATISGGSASSFISGPARRVIGLGSSFVFPLGSATANKYRPAQLANTSAGDTWTVEYVGKDPSVDGYNHSSFNHSNLGKVSGFEYWNLNRAGSTTADVTLTYNTGSYIPSNIGNVTNLRVVRWNGTQWDLPPGGGTHSQSGTNITGTVTVTNVTSFSPITFGSLDTDSPLPVTWLSFTGTWINKDVHLVWKTAQEFNSDHFEVERSTNGIDFYQIGSLPGGGTRSTPKEYSFVDAEASTYHKYYYRIRQVDMDSHASYSNVIALQAIGEQTQRWTAYPNPVEGSDHFMLEETDPVIASDNVSVTLVSGNGIVLLQATGSVEKINERLKLLIPGIASGIYILQVSDGSDNESFRIVRQ
jgi:fibronectin-binding autotransporter adhesin